MYAILEMFGQLYKFRTCSLNLTPSNINNRKFKVCLEYHIGNCKGGEGLQQEEEYIAEIDQAKHILKGNLSLPKGYFEK
jgi:excinuclease ABC subunit C